MDDKASNIRRAEAAIALLGRRLVGHIGLREAIDALREAMYEEAISRCRGNNHAAARLLSVDRRIVRRMAERFGTVPRD